MKDMGPQKYSDWWDKLQDGPYQGGTIYTLMRDDPAYIQLEIIDKGQYIPGHGGSERMRQMIDLQLAAITDPDIYLTEKE